MKIMKNQFAKIVAVLMVLAMAVSVFGLCASAAETTDANTTVLLGDVNLNGEVTISDATLIQKALAKLATLDEVQAAAANVSTGDEVNIKDVTMIQKWLAKYDVNDNIGKPMATADEATPEEKPVDPSTPEEKPVDPSTKDEPVVDPSTKDEPVVDPSTKDEPVVDPVVPEDPATKDEPVVDPVVPEDPATDDEATADEVTYYLVGYINGADYGIEADWANLGDYAFVNGTVTVEFTADSYVIVKDENLAGFWTDGWLGAGVTEVVLGEFGGNNNKVMVSAGTHTFTWDAATCTLTVA